MRPILASCTRQRAGPEHSGREHLAPRTTSCCRPRCASGLQTIPGDMSCQEAIPTLQRGSPPVSPHRPWILICPLSTAVSEEFRCVRGSAVRSGRPHHGCNRKRRHASHLRRHSARVRLHTGPATTGPNNAIHAQLASRQRQPHTRRPDRLRRLLRRRTRRRRLHAAHLNNPAAGDQLPRTRPPLPRQRLLRHRHRRNSRKQHP